MPPRSISILVLLATWLFGVIVPPLSGAATRDRQRIELFAPDGQRQGYAILRQDTGRLDVYDAAGNRTGWAREAVTREVGRPKPLEASGRSWKLGPEFTCEFRILSQLANVFRHPRSSESLPAFMVDITTDAPAFRAGTLWLTPQRSSPTLVSTCHACLVPVCLEPGSIMTGPGCDHARAPGPLLMTVQRCVAAGCRMNRRKTSPNTYQLLLDDMSMTAALA